jgi:hypothetical protein
MTSTNEIWWVPTILMVAGANDPNIFNFAMQESSLAQQRHRNLREVEKTTQLSKRHGNERACCIKDQLRMA